MFTRPRPPQLISAVSLWLFSLTGELGLSSAARSNNFHQETNGQNLLSDPPGCLYIATFHSRRWIVFVPESPRFLLHQGKEARQRGLWSKLRGSALTTEELEARNEAEMVRGMEEEKKTAKSVVGSTCSEVMHCLLSHPRPLLLTCDLLGADLLGHSVLVNDSLPIGSGVCS